MKGKLSLNPYHKNATIISMSEEDYHDIANDVNLDARIFVYSDLTYTIDILDIDIDNLESISLYVNDNYEPCHLDNNRLYFSYDNGRRKRLFLDYFGFVKLSLIIRYKDERVIQLYSDYISVLVKNDELNDAVKGMVDFVYSNQDYLLFANDAKSRDMAGFNQSDQMSLSSKILLAEEIAQIYENSFGYFKMNSRFKIIQHEVIDHAEKLQQISTKTLTYIATHPADLKQGYGVNGIKIGKRSYYPDTTLTIQNKYSTDIYENQVVVGFIHKMIADVTEMYEEVSSLLEKIPFYTNRLDDYVHSSYFIFSRTEQGLKENQKRLEELIGKFEMLWNSYNNVMAVTPCSIEQVPKPSAIFFSVPQYNLIFNYIYRWFNYGIYKLDQERFMMSFISVSSLYEVYVLAKMLTIMRRNGFVLESSNRFIYKMRESALYINTFCNNTFCFENNGRKIVLYYQPVIYDIRRSHDNGIWLFRNNAISVSGESGSNANSYYYTPDYLIKVSDMGKEKYFILDAKFSNRDNIKSFQIVPLTYKYLFSISTISEADEVVGMGVFYGKALASEQKESVYDLELGERHLSPMVEMIPFAEGIDEESHTNYIEALLQELFK